MITRIDRLNNLAVFKNFRWNGNLLDFKKKNIIYGWNYSGKTTLSRMFFFLQQGAIQTRHSECTFTLQQQNGDSFSQAEIDELDFKVRVFNSDFIKNNLKWDSGEMLSPVEFDVGENIELRERIEKLEEKITQIEGSDSQTGKKDPLKSGIEEFNELKNSKFTSEARRIKNGIFNSLIDFDKRHLKNIRDDIGQNLDNYIFTNDSKVQELISNATAKNNKSKIDKNKITLNLSLKQLINNTIEVLITQPSEEEIIETLEKDQEKYDWAKRGLDVNDSDKCAFCNNEIGTARLEALIKYFSNEAAVLRNNISALKRKIDQEIEQISSFAITISPNDFTESLKKEFSEVSALSASLINNYTNDLKSLKSELERKENDKLFNEITLNHITEDSHLNLEKWILNLKDIIDRHNSIIDNFEENQNKDRKTLKKHLVASFLKRENYYEKKKLKNFSKRNIRRWDCLKQKIKTEIDTLESELKSILAAKEELNKYITTFLNRNDIQIEVTPDDMFRLKRGDHHAFNLSEGEKTAIAFSYFLVILEGLKTNNELKNTIVFIDDPISSLDSNHISQVFSLINTFFFRKGLNPEEPNRITECFKQIFISTHNLEFFSFLKDSRRMSGCNYYFIKRIESDTSILKRLPKSIKKYKSEYVYLFDLIYNYYKGGCSEDDSNFILIPNALRKFLEIYTLMKIPHVHDSFANRVQELVGDINELKTLHHFSHFTSFEKLTQHDQLILNLPTATQELISLLEKDQQHYHSLLRSINETPPTDC